MKRFSTYLTLLLCFSMPLAKADIGETYVLKQERKRVLSEIKQLQSDSISTVTSAVLDSLHFRIVALDEEIFASYDESISRMAAQQLASVSDNKLAVYLALATTAAALFFAFLLLMARSRVLNNSNAGLREMYRQLILDLVMRTSPEKTTAQRLLRVNTVVLVGLVMMSVSIMAYLLRSL